MYVVWKTRKLSASRPCERCADRGRSRTSFIPHLVESRRVDGRPRQIHLTRLPSIRSCCLRSEAVRSAWWKQVDVLLEQYEVPDTVWFKLYDTVPPVGGEEDWDDWPPRADATGDGVAAAAVLGLRWPCRVEEVKTAFRSQAKRTHPDLGGRAEDFRRVSEAYQRLLELLSGPLR